MKRAKVKGRIALSQKDLEEVLQMLDVTPDLIAEQVVKDHEILRGRTGITEIFTNRVAQHILRSLKTLKRAKVRAVYEVICRSTLGTDNLTWMIKQMGYVLSEALGCSTPLMRAHRAQMWHNGPQDTIDIWGGVWNVEQRKVYQKHKALLRASPWSLDTTPDLLPGKKQKGGRFVRASREQRPKQSGPTIASVMRDCLTQKGGATREEILEAIRKHCGSRWDSRRTPKTVNVQLSYHFPNRYGTAFTQKGAKYILRED